MDFFFLGSPVFLRILILAFYNLSADSLLFKVRASHHWQEKRQQGSGLENVGYPGLRTHLNGRSSWFRWALSTCFKCSLVAEGHCEGGEDSMAMFSTRALGCEAECGMRANLVSTDSAVSCQYGREESYGTSDRCRQGGARWEGRCSL